MLSLELVEEVGESVAHGSLQFNAGTCLKACKHMDARRWSVAVDSGRGQGNGPPKTRSAMGMREFQVLCSQEVASKISSLALGPHFGSPGRSARPSLYDFYGSFGFLEAHGLEASGKLYSHDINVNTCCCFF